MISPGKNLRTVLAEENPLQVVGTINAYCALLAKSSGFRAIYLSGAGIANASFGLPDLGITTLNDVCEEVRRVTEAVDLPLLVDADTGWGNAFNISRTIRELIRAGRQVATLRTRKPLNDADIVPIKQLFRVNVANL